jgi:hypothetical protein
MSDASTLQFYSPQQFYFFLKEKNLSFPQLHAFMDNVELFLNGCPCDAETYWRHVMDEFRYFPKRDFLPIKKTLNCQRIDFSFENINFSL